MEAGGKDRSPMLAPGNYNPPYKFKWTEMTVLVVEGSSETTIERNIGKAIVNSPPSTYDQEPTMVAKDDEMSKEKEIDKLMALISLSFKKIYKPTNNNLRTLSNTSRAHQDNTLRINRGTGYNNQRAANVAGARENVAYHKEKMLLYKQEEAGIQLSAEQADWRDDTDDEPDDQELEVHYLYMANIQEVTPDAADNSGHIFDIEPMQKTNQLMFKDLKKFQAELDRYHDVNYASKDEIECAKAKGDLINEKGAFAHQETISIMSQAKEAQNNFHKTREDKEIEKVIALENKVKNTNVIAPGMYKVHTNPNQTRIPQLPQDIRKTNKRVSFSIGVIPTTSVSRPHLKSNQLKDRVMSNNSQGKKQEVEYYCRNFNFSNNKMSVSAYNDSLNAKTLNVNFVCVTCGKCVLNDNHDMCVLHYINGVNARTKQLIDVPISTSEPKRTMNQSVATPLKRTVALESTNQKPRSKIRKQYEQISKICKWWYPKFTPSGYTWKPKTSTVNVKLNFSMPLGNKSRTTNISEPIALRKSTVSNTLSSSNSFAACSRGTDLYSITLQDAYTPNPICLMAKDTSSQAWLWHRRLSYLNFDTINLLSKYNIMTGLPKLKSVKDHL
ncbi:retrovirus-related pol polyprotein from transposon TNT 1-94 [Tanacetum coccineum]